MSPWQHALCFQAPPLRPVQPLMSETGSPAGVRPPHQHFLFALINNWLLQSRLSPSKVFVFQLKTWVFQILPELCSETTVQSSRKLTDTQFCCQNANNRLMKDEKNTSFRSELFSYTAGGGRRRTSEILMEGSCGCWDPEMSRWPPALLWSSAFGDAAQVRAELLRLNTADHLSICVEAWPTPATSFVFIWSSNSRWAAWL